MNPNSPDRPIAPTADPPRQRITPRALLDIKQLSEPQIHPDGVRVAFVVTEADFDESRSVSHLWLTEWQASDPASPAAPSPTEISSEQSRTPSPAVPPPEKQPASVPPMAQDREASEPDDAAHPDDLTRQLTFSHEGETRPRWSPDGRSLAFLSARPDTSEPLPEDEEDEAPHEQVWMLPIDGGEARKLTAAREGVLDYAWTPDSRAIVFLAPEPRPRPLESVRKEERARHKMDPVVEQEDRLRRQLWRVDLEEHRPKRLFTGDYGVQEFALSPDGERLCYGTNYSGEWNDYHQTDLWILDLADGTTVKLVERAGGKHSPRWSPDGRQVAFLSWLDPQLSYSRQSLFVADLPLTSAPAPTRDLPPTDLSPMDLSPADLSPADLSPTDLSPGSEARKEEPDPRIPFPQSETNAAKLEVSEPGADGKRQSVAPPWEEVGWEEVGGTGSPCRLLSGLDDDISAFEWSRFDRYIYALASVRTGSAVVRVAVDPILPGEKGGAEGEPAASLTRLELDSAPERSDLNLDPEGNAIVYVQESDTALPEIFLRDSEGGIHPLTRLNAEFGETYRLPRQEVVRWTSADGLSIEGVLVYPLDYQEGTRAPLIVQIHGGPKGRATNTLQSYSMPPVWSAEGYAVLRPNYRGSEGYGNAFAVANRRDLGGGDFADIMAGVDHVIALGVADSDRLGVMGGSYGGYMTNWAIGHTDRFRAAISMFGIFHLQTDYSNSQLSRWDNDYLGAYYWEDPDIYRRLSPGSYIENIRTPTLILHGDDDQNTFISNSKEMYQALRHRQVTTQFVHYPREEHGLHEPNHRLDEMRRCLAWMDRYVRQDAAPRVYRVGDRVPNADGSLELCVTQAAIVSFLGQPDPTAPADMATALLEVVVTLHNPDTRRPTAPLTLALADLRLERNAEPSVEGTEAGTARIDTAPLLPIGVPLDLPGGKVLVEGENLRIAQHPDAESGQLAFACAAVFRVPAPGGDGRLCVAAFPPVAIFWTPADAESKDDVEAGSRREW